MDALNKKKRASASCDQSDAFDDEAKAKIKYKTLLNEYLELQKEFVSRKRKLQAAKQKRETILGEVRFLRRKSKYLLKSQAPDMGIVPLHIVISDVKRNALLEERNHSISEASPGNCNEVLVSNSHVKNEEAEGNEEEEVRFTKKLKNHLIRDKERKLCWPRSSHFEGLVQ